MMIRLCITEACTNRRFPLMRPRFLVAGNSPKSTVLFKADTQSHTRTHTQTTTAVYIVDIKMLLLDQGDIYLMQFMKQNYQHS